LQQPGEISELIFDTDSDEARLSSDVSSVQGRFESVSGYHNLNLSAKQPVVTSPAVQFRPVPLKKRMLVRMGQVNRLNSNNPAMETPLLPSEQCSTHIYRGPQRKEGQ